MIRSFINGTKRNTYEKESIEEFLKRGGKVQKLRTVIFRCRQFR